MTRNTSTLYLLLAVMISSTPAFSATAPTSKPPADAMSGAHPKVDCDMKGMDMSKMTAEEHEKMMAQMKDCQPSKKTGRSHKPKPAEPSSEAAPKVP